MKRIVTLVMLIIACHLTSGCSALFGNYDQVQFAQYMGGYWGSWKPFYNWAYYGTPDDFIVYSKNNHPSEYCFHVKVNNFNPRWVQKDEYQSYTGTLEYTTSLNSYDIKQNSKWFVDVELGFLSHGDSSRTRPANIRIKKYGKLFYYNIYFDDVGFGVTIPWKKY